MFTSVIDSWCVRCDNSHFSNDLKEVLWSEITETLNGGNSEIFGSAVLLENAKKNFLKEKDGGEKEIMSDMECLTRCPGLP